MVNSSSNHIVCVNVLTDVFTSALNRQFAQRLYPDCNAVGVWKAAIAAEQNQRSL
ncbi:MAG: hypothetical protein N3E45_11620 [Oscillatoriaceae bacterium SKW80]|nr:hypothetical protein [Oscillatoriaceae bacterium SKYG93]MCX8121451.1 hypothetical protein [Oscillatoriaceae bacterium SKW80]MDW8452963.1 hypothetical protein [Oscillatoriaceae cyanobacterium SKYGB_i_bin93]HIK27799.1 hypothetical protein [Oscillatoriaceae cyanobacterium M7585_C2015_266]